MNRKFVSAVIAALMAVSLFSCGSSDESSQTTGSSGSSSSAESSSKAESSDSESSESKAESSETSEDEEAVKLKQKQMAIDRARKELDEMQTSYIDSCVVPFEDSSWGSWKYDESEKSDKVTMVTISFDADTFDLFIKNIKAIDDSGNELPTAYDIYQIKKNEGSLMLYIAVIKVNGEVDPGTLDFIIEHKEKDENDEYISKALKTNDITQGFTEEFLNAAYWTERKGLGGDPDYHMPKIVKVKGRYYITSQHDHDMYSSGIYFDENGVHPSTNDNAYQLIPITGGYAAGYLTADDFTLVVDPVADYRNAVVDRIQDKGKSVQINIIDLMYDNPYYLEYMDVLKNHGDTSEYTKTLEAERKEQLRNMWLEVDDGDGGITRIDLRYGWAA